LWNEIYENPTTKNDYSTKKIMKKKYYVCILLFHSEDQLILGHMKKEN